MALLCIYVQIFLNYISLQNEQVCLIIGNLFQSFCFQDKWSSKMQLFSQSSPLVQIL